jgi:hypothetical protein
MDVVEINGPHSHMRLSSYLLRVIFAQLRWPEPSNEAMVLNETQETTFRYALDAACTRRRD